MKKLHRFAFSLALAAAALFTVQAADAQSAADYPEKPVKIIVPFSAGGPNDILARLIADEMTTKWGQNFIVENKPGGGTVIGSQAAASAPADGYTILMVSFSTSTNVTLRKSLPYDTKKDFTPLIRIAEAPSILVVNKAVDVSTVEDLVKLGKANPGEIVFGSGGVGTATNLAGHLLVQTADLDMISAPYKGGGPAMIDLLGGRLTWMFGTFLQTLPTVEAGDVKAIAVSSLKRNPSLPDVPAVAETYPGFEATSWWGMFLPAGVPEDIIVKLNKAINEVIAAPKVSEFLKNKGTTPVGGSSEEFRKFFDATAEKWGKVIKAAKLPLK